MKRILILTLSVLFCTFSSAQQVFTDTLFLSGTDKDHTVDWQFYCTDGARSGQWSTIPVPSCWEQQGFGAYNYGHDKEPHHEQGLYRTTFNIPRTWENRRVFIAFEGVMTDAEVKINGQLAGPIHQGAFYRFKYDITSLINRTSGNLLEVKVSKESSNPSINEAERRADYWIFGGIFRPVYLEAQPQTFIDHVAIDARHTGEIRADVVTDSKGECHDLSVSLSIYDAQNKLVAKSPVDALNNDSTRLTLHAPDIKPWTPETPHLYTAIFSLSQGSKTVHSFAQRFGFRTIEVKPADGFYVNGQKIMFKGVCRHTFWPESGRTSSKALAIEDVNLIKDMNMNAVRMSHYPPDQFFLDVCDSLGLYVIDELAGWQSPYDGPTACRLVGEMIRRDVNHPSIVIWANGNEGGFPHASRPLYRQLDIQQRQVVEPWSRYEGVDTKHYPRFQPAKERATKGDVIFMPTESLHGLHDGGHGAGLEDYYTLMLNTPTAAGQFLWVFADEGLVRHDLNDSIDVFNNKAPDGILGPHHEKEGSFYTIKEIWSPIHIEKPDFDHFDGTLRVANRFHFTNLNQCSFKVALHRFATPLNLTDGQLHSTPLPVSVPDAKPQTADALLRLDLPTDWKQHDMLSITAIDHTGRVLNTWRWTISTPQQLVSRILPRTNRTRVKIQEDDSRLTILTKQSAVTFDKQTGALLSIGQAKGFGRARFAGMEAPFTRLTHQRTPEGYQVTAHYAEGQKLAWTILSDGWLRLDYSYVLNGDYDYAGITFDAQEEEVVAAQLLADGPYHVWKNRLKGTTYGLHNKTYNNTITGQTWEYPEFKGYYSHFTAMRLQYLSQTLTILSPTANTFLHLFTPERPIHYSKNADPAFPDGQLSLLTCIPGIGTKFSRAEQEGPQGAKNHFNQHLVNGTVFLKVTAPQPTH